MTILVFIIILKVSYLAVLYYLHELQLPMLDIESFLGKQDKYKVLVIYPHPDDETMASGGLIAKLSDDPKYDLSCVCLTHGEYGDELWKLAPEQLAPIRAQEFAAAMGVLGVKNYAIWNFGDGNVKKQMAQLRQKLGEYLRQQQFDLVVTYERAGLYGHPDHIALSQVVHDLEQSQGGFKVLYMTLAQNLLKAIKLPVHMTDEEDRHLVQASAEYKLFLGRQVWTRYRAASKYKSQKLNHNLPLWMQMFMLPWEYYTSKYE